MDLDKTATPRPAVVNLTTLATGSHAEDKSEPEVDFTPLAQMINSLYSGNYQNFFKALSNVETKFLSQDRYLYEHRRWYVKEMRLRAYAQLLQSYKIVGLESMAQSFGVSVDWLDRDLAPFIASQRLPCTIDRVRGVIETRMADDKNKQYVCLQPPWSLRTCPRKMLILFTDTTISSDKAISSLPSCKSTAKLCVLGVVNALR